MKLLLLHPLPLDGSAWDPVRRQLASSGIDAEIEVVAPNLADLGDSIEAWAAAALELAGSDPLVVVGCSVGGSCAVEVARLAPDRVRALVLVGTKAGHRPEPDVRDAAVRVLADEGMAAAWPRWWEPLFAPEADPHVVEHGRRIAVAQDIDAVIRGVVAFHARPDRASYLESVPVPVHVVSGEHDAIPAEPTALAARLRHGTFHRIAGAGHYVPLERPAELASIIAATVETVETAGR